MKKLIGLLCIIALIGGCLPNNRKLLIPKATEDPIGDPIRVFLRRG